MKAAEGTDEEGTDEPWRSAWPGEGGWTPTLDAAVGFSTEEQAYGALLRAGRLLPVRAGGVVIGVRGDGAGGMNTPAEQARSANIALLRSEGVEISEEAERDMVIEISEGDL